VLLLLLLLLLLPAIGLHMLSVVAVFTLEDL